RLASVTATRAGRDNPPPRPDCAVGDVVPRMLDEKVSRSQVQPRPRAVRTCKMVLVRSVSLRDWRLPRTWEAPNATFAVADYLKSDGQRRIMRACRARRFPRVPNLTLCQQRQTVPEREQRIRGVPWLNSISSSATARSRTAPAPPCARP